MTTALPAPAESKPGAVKRLSVLLFRLIAVLILAALLLGAGFGAGWYYFARPASPVLEALRALQGGEDTAEKAEPGTEAADGEPHKVPRPVPEEEKFVTTYYSFPDPLTSNLGDSRRFLQVTVALSTQYDAKVMANVETNRIALQSDMLVVISGFSEETLKARDGREKLAVALRDAINARLEALEGFGGVDAVWFPSFVMQ